jgi:erythromycin esterase-like protein/adenine/guanine phosphoribosyltransferase-like PRPP-binding protein
MRFRNRTDAGQQLASALTRFAHRTDVIVLALPRGGVPVAAEIAKRLQVPLDVFLVRKLGAPGHPELAIGAIAAGGIEVLSHRLIADLGIPASVVQQIAVRERIELDRRDVAFRGNRTPPVVRNRVVILVDDGLATGATMEAAIVALKKSEPAQLVVAVPVGAPETCQRLGRMVDRLVCLSMPTPFSAVGQWYDDFAQTTDEEVREAFASFRHSSAATPGNARGSDARSLIQERAIRLRGDPAQYDALIDGAGSARVVLLGEATHGTHEFYRERAFITRRLIEEKGFAGVAVEADWPDAYRINRFVRGTSADEDAVQSLGDFGRFPTWMWRNADVLDFIGWMRQFNEAQAPDDRAGFYGLDLYSLRASTQAVLAYLDKVDPDAARRARARYACFDQYGPEMQQYGYATAFGMEPSCEREAVSQLLDLHRRRTEYASRDGRVAADEFFFAEQNARLVKNAEQYYRTMFAGRVDSWNLRDHHMAETLHDLLAFLERTRPGARLVVWAHNSHLGDARATEMGEGGELNLGQLARAAYDGQAVLVGFTTYTGSVTAATDWDGPAYRRHVRPALAGSYERLLHEAAIPRLLLPLRTDPDLAAALMPPRLERAIGVIYVPESERRSHYFHARLSEQFDYVLHFDETRALEPLERTPVWEAGEVAETFPFGL